jgi:HEAT repeat protein
LGVLEITKFSEELTSMGERSQPDRSASNSDCPMSLDLPSGVSSYLDSICRRYARWQVYTLTDVVGESDRQKATTIPLLDLGLMVQRVDPSEFGKANCDKEPKNNESKVERFTVLAGVRKYAADHVLLVGRPGSGKSTALARLLLEEAQKAQQDSSVLIPVLVELRYYKTSVLELMRSFFKTHGLLIDRSDIETLLFEGRFLLLVDGLNELPSDEARREVKAFEQTNRKTSMIFTTRDLGVGGDLNLNRKLEMQSLTEKQMQAFVRSYLLTQGDALLRQLGSRLRELGQTPLLLWMLCSVFANNQNRVPSNLGSVFREFTQIHYCKLKEDAPVAEGSREYWAEMLQALAWKMTQGKSATELQVAIDRSDAIQVLKAFLTDKVAYPETYARNRLNDLLKHHLIQLGTGTQIEFRHQLIQEYYAAEQLLKQLPQLNYECLKWDYLNYLKWTEPFALMLELVEDKQEALRVVELALEVDWQLGARLAGKVKLEWQEETIEMVRSLQLPQMLKIHLLGVTRSEAAIPGLTELLKDGDSSVVRRAAFSLGEIGSEATIPALIERLKDENPSVRESAAFALGKIGSEAAIPALIERLKDEDRLRRWNLVSALYEIGSQAAISALTERLKDENPSVRWSAAEALGKIGSEAAIPALIERLKDENSLVRGHVASALGEIVSEDAIAALIELLKDEDFDVRENVAFALGKIGSEAAIPMLVERLKHEDSSVRWNAAFVLGKINSEAAIPPLIERLKDGNSSVAGRAAVALSEIGSETAVPGLTKLLKDEDSSVARIAALTLGLIGSEAAILALTECLKDGNSSVSKNAAFVLDKINSEAAIPPLIERLKDGNSSVAGRATVALSEVGSEAAVPGLTELLKDKSFPVRANAANSLGEIGSESVILLLKHRMKDEKIATNEIIVALTAIQNRCKRYNAQPATSTEKPIPAEAKTSDQKSEQAIVHQHFHAPVYGVAGNVEGDMNVHPPEPNPDEILNQA